MKQYVLWHLHNMYIVPRAHNDIHLNKTEFHAAPATAQNFFQLNPHARQIKLFQYIATIHVLHRAQTEPHHVVPDVKNYNARNAFLIYHFGIDSVPSIHTVDLYFCAYILSRFYAQNYIWKKIFANRYEFHKKIPHLPGGFIFSSFCEPECELRVTAFLSQLSVPPSSGLAHVDWLGKSPPDAGLVHPT